METGIVTITQDELNQLKDDSLFLNALRSAGVDNWECYSFAQDLFVEAKRYSQQEVNNETNSL